MRKLTHDFRDDAWRLLTEYTKSDSLLKHALAVEAAVRGYARKFGEDEEGWGMVGAAARLRLRALADASRIIRSAAARSCARRAIPSG